MVCYFLQLDMNSGSLCKISYHLDKFLVQIVHTKYIFCKTDYLPELSDWTIWAGIYIKVAWECVNIRLVDVFTQV